MSTKTFLNALRKKDRRLPEPEPGRWKLYENFLVDYAADIAVQGTVEDRRGMANLPTVFARPLYFAEVLADDRHPAYRAILGQWRGLLATFALSEWLGLGLEAARIDLPQHPEGEPAGTRPLWTILRSQLPRPEREWDHWWLLLCDGKLIGATSPWSIAYTPAEYACPVSIPWQRDGALIDPREYFDSEGNRRSVELSLLAVWLERMIDGNRDRWGLEGRNHLDVYLQVISRRLAEWQIELSRYRQEAHRGLRVEPSSRIEEAPYSAFLGRLRVLDRGQESDLLLSTSKKGQVIVLSRSRLDPGNRVFGPSMVSDVDFGQIRGSIGEANWKTRGGRTVPVPYVIAEEAFFPAKIAQVSIAETGWCAGNDRLAVPLTSTFFQYFSLEDLLDQRVRIEVSPDDKRINVRLRLPLSGGELAIEKSYDRARDVVGELDETPALAHWPDFYDPAWKHNYAMLGAFQEGAALLAAPLTSSTATLRRSSTEGEKILRLWSSAEPILGFVLYSSDRGKETEAGVVLRSNLRGPSEKTGRGWRVAVDFGTSNSHVLFAEESLGEPRPLLLKGRTVLLTAPGAEAFRLPVVNDFYPVEAVQPPFPTLLLRDDVSFLAGRQSPFGAFTARFRSVIEKQSLGSLMQDVKWSSGGTAEDSPLRAYLSYLLRYLLCEAWAAGVARVKFEWSYPLSLSPAGRNSMDEFWREAEREFSIPAEVGEDARSLEVSVAPGTSESVALCRYLAHTQALSVGAGGLSIAVDIGGGSSDIGFWIRGQLRDQVSMKIAANDVLPRFAVSEELLRDLQRVCEPDPQRWRGTADFQRRSAVLFNSLLVKAQPTGETGGAVDPDAHPVARALAGGELHRAEFPWQGMRSVIYLFGFGLAFYLGLHARRFIKDLRIQEARVGFAGRGASLFSWVATGKVLEPMLGAAFAEGLGLGEEENRRVKVEFALPGGSGRKWSRLKQETAHGLLLERLQGENREGADRVIAGEVNWTDESGAPIDWEAEITAKDLPRLVPPANHDSGYMAHLVTSVLPRFTEELGLDGPGLSGLHLSSAKVQNLLTYPDGRLVVLQPLFAYEIKALMDTYLDSYLEHGGR